MRYCKKRDHQSAWHTLSAQQVLIIMATIVYELMHLTRGRLTFTESSRGYATRLSDGN